MENITTALTYHDRTKHRPQRYAASLGYMDWDTQPDPFRTYEGSKKIALAHTNLTPPYHLLFDQGALPAAPLCLESVSQLLRYSLGLAAWKSVGGASWALRCNASSGNLQPSECYLLLPPIGGISTQTSLCHYAPKEHALEVLCEYDSPLPNTQIVLLLSSVLWREAWKYGERSWRYCQLDAGHAAAAVRISAATLGWESCLVRFDTGSAAEALGLNDPSRFAPTENESVDLALLISPEPIVRTPFDLPLPPSPPSYPANILSPSHHEWPILPIIDEATQGMYPQTAPLSLSRTLPDPSKSAGEIILKRRSAQMMDGSGISEIHFRRILDASLFLPETADVHFVLFVHRVEGLEKGFYCYVRAVEELENLRTATDPDFIWKDFGRGLYLLREGDYRGAAQKVSCNQEIAREGAFSFGMLCRFASALEERGAVGYKNLYHQCGMIGQLLYLEATSLGLSATGIGCFLDDEVHTLLGLKNQYYQSLYHFTVGRAIVDTRLTTLPPY